MVFKVSLNNYNFWLTKIKYKSKCKYCSSKSLKIIIYLTTKVFFFYQFYYSLLFLLFLKTETTILNLNLNFVVYQVFYPYNNLSNIIQIINVLWCIIEYNILT